VSQINVWRKIREDGSTGLLVVLAGVAAAVRGGLTAPELLRLRWRLRDTRAELAAARADLGRYLASCLHAGGAVEPTDEQAVRRCQRIDALLAEERRLMDDLSGGSER
jgi:hypothetical protein